MSYKAGNAVLLLLDSFMFLYD